MHRITISNLQGIKALMSPDQELREIATEIILEDSLSSWKLISVVSSTEGIQWNLPRLVSLGCNGLLTIQFDDITEEQFSNCLAHGKHLQLFSKVQGEKVIQFLNELNAEERLIVHCEGGISRSAAIAYYAAEYLGLDSKQEFNQELYFPNPYVLEVLNSLVELRWAERFDRR